MRELAAQFLALAEKQGATVPLMIGHRLMGMFLAVYGRHRGRSSAFRSGDRALRSCRASSAGDAFWPRRPGVQSCAIVRWLLWMLGYPEAALADADQALKDAREIGQAATLMYRADPHIVDPSSSAGITRQQTRNLDELVALADEKGALFWKARGMMNQGCAIGHDRQSLGRSPHDHLRDHCVCGQREQQCYAVATCHI